MLISLVDLVLPACLGRGTVTYGPGGDVASECHPTTSDALRQMLDFSAFAIVAGPVFWWHLRQGRRLFAPTDRPLALPDGLRHGEDVALALLEQALR